MSAVEYYLFRAKFITSRQLHLLGVGKNITPVPQEIFKAAILERPSGVLWRNHSWHIGNVYLFNKTQGSFAIGKIPRSSIEKFDETTGNFIEEEIESSPYTYCVFDLSLGIIAIANKPSLSSDIKNIAKKIEKLFSMTYVVTIHAITVEVRPIPDPDSFITSIENAYKIFKFKATFRGPNPFDADEYFQKPMTNYLAKANGEKGETTIQGSNLNKNTLIEVAKSTAATGNDATAKIQASPRQKAITVYLKNNPAKYKFNENESKKSILDAMISMYYRVRYDDDGNRDQ